jgi:hypothetical protein
MCFARVSSLFLAIVLAGSGLGTGSGLAAAQAQTASSPAASSPDASSETIAQLLEQLKAQDARLKELEAQVSQLKAAQSNKPEGGGEGPSAPAATVPEATPLPEIPPPPPPQEHEHSMQIPGGGPVLKFRGFFDFNFGAGSIANPLVFPIVDDGCGTCGNPLNPPHTAFQAGEFDLFLTSRLSDHLNFLAEIVLGPDTTNEFGLDIERYTLTYKVNRYFSAGAGRFHTSIGYYNTAYHHGNWFSTAEGRPIMYLFEDSGGILPVHMVGLNFNGAVPNTEKLGLHWIAEVGNGLSSNTNAVGAESVQNFYSDRNYKATNLAGFIKPEAIAGLQIGGSWYHDELVPTGLPVVTQNIESAYVVYLTSEWESLTEGVLLSNHLDGATTSFRSPMAYTQIARKFGIYKPYFRYQYVRDNPNDPVNRLKGIYYGPSPGLRIDFTEYAAFKLQFNHLYQSNQTAGNGLNAQVAFTF